MLEPSAHCQVSTRVSITVSPLLVRTFPVEKYSLPAYQQLTPPTFASLDPWNGSGNCRLPEEPEPTVLCTSGVTIPPANPVSNRPPAEASCVPNCVPSESAVVISAVVAVAQAAIPTPDPMIPPAVLPISGPVSIVKLRYQDRGNLLPLGSEFARRPAAE